MLDCEVPNIFVFILCVGWYLLGIKIGKKEVAQDLNDNLERIVKKYAEPQESEDEE